MWIICCLCFRLSSSDYYPQRKMYQIQIELFSRVPPLLIIGQSSVQYIMSIPFIYIEKNRKLLEVSLGSTSSSFAEWKTRTEASWQAANEFAVTVYVKAMKSIATRRFSFFFPSCCWWWTALFCSPLILRYREKTLLFFVLLVTFLLEAIRRAGVDDESGAISCLSFISLENDDLIVSPDWIDSLNQKRERRSNFSHIRRPQSSSSSFMSSWKKKKKRNYI